MRKIFASVLLCACLCGCGVKPGSIELPQDNGTDPFPRIYPDSGADPGAPAAKQALPPVSDTAAPPAAPLQNNGRLLTGYEKE
ncbi:MAG: hypothetical protein KDJ75_08045 [Alphaproteobacteria bacterium]|nr:hypothetical protein [Alphaproteobacteria bacterium]